MEMLLKLFGMLGKDGQSQLLGSLGGLLSNGGLNDILAKFGQAGLGNKAQSWVSAGANEKLSAKEVQAALGPAEIDRLAREAGVTPRQASNGLAKLLPSAVDKLTPMGSVPEQSQVDSSLGSLAEMFGL